MIDSDYMIELQVQKVCQPIGDFFVASITAQDLVEISYADVRRLVGKRREIERYLGIQRPLSPIRVKQIKKYIEGGDATFPTAVIVAVDERCAEYEEKSEVGGILTLRSYEPEAGIDEVAIPWRKIAKVLDGQHRIAAFMSEHGEFSYPDKSFDINLAIFVGADISEQASIFATVNLAQTKVNRSLAYDLTELAKTRSPQRSCHDVAVALDGEKSSPLYHRIKRLGVATPGRAKEPLTQAAFVESLIRLISEDPVTDRNRLLDGEKLEKPSDAELQKCPFRGMFIANKDLDIAEIIFNYFSAVKKKWPNSWNDLNTSGNLLPKSNAFKALMKFLHKDVYITAVNGDYGKVPSVRTFYTYLEPLDLTDQDFTTENFVPGSSGQSSFLKMLRGEISREDMIDRG